VTIPSQDDREIITMKRLSVCALAACAVTAGCGVGAEVRTTDVAARGAVLSADVRAIVAREATVMVPVGARPLSATEAEQLGTMPGTMVPPGDADDRVRRAFP
jgi:hypothetical protein